MVKYRSVSQMLQNQLQRTCDSGGLVL